MMHACTKCGNVDEVKLDARWEPLSPGLVETLWHFAAAVGRKGRNDIHLEEDMTLTHRQHANFQKLRYHALVAKVDREQRTGHWLLTHRGGQFLKNAIEVPRRVLVQENRVTGYSEEKTRVSDFYGKYPHFETRFAYEIADGDAFIPERQQSRLFDLRPRPVGL